jgi:hypothetical protein
MSVPLLSLSPLWVSQVPLTFPSPHMDSTEHYLCMCLYITHQHDLLPQASFLIYLMLFSVSLSASHWIWGPKGTLLRKATLKAALWWHPNQLSCIGSCCVILCRIFLGLTGLPLTTYCPGSLVELPVYLFKALTCFPTLGFFFHWLEKYFLSISVIWTLIIEVWNWDEQEQSIALCSGSQRPGLGIKIHE